MTRYRLWLRVLIGPYSFGYLDFISFNRVLTVQAGLHLVYKGPDLGEKGHDSNLSWKWRSWLDYNVKCTVEALSHIRVLTKPCIELRSWPALSQIQGSWHYFWDKSFFWIYVKREIFLPYLIEHYFIDKVLTGPYLKYKNHEEILCGPSRPLPHR